MESLPDRAWVEIDLQALEENVKKIKASLPKNVKYISVLKADAYGHSMAESLLRFLRGGSDMFAVANLYEASRVREIVANKPVLILSPILKQEYHLLFDYNAIASVSSYEEALCFDEFAFNAGKILELHIKIDSGMGRSGIWFENAGDELQKIFDLKNIKVSGLFSHLSSADSDEAFTYRQVEILKNIAQKYASEDMLIHIHNSAALKYINIEKPFNAVRVGLLQYGINPYEDNSAYDGLNLKPALAFKSRILAVSEYEGKKIASVSAGYADGVPSYFTKDARVLLKAKRCPIIDWMGLDEIIIDVSDVEDVAEGDEISFIGKQADEEITLADYSVWTRRIPWETMVAIPRRVRRILRT